MLDLAGPKGEESLELGEDDMLAGGEAAGDQTLALKTDDDFLLTPLEEAADVQESSSESGSQVIALDTEEAGIGMVDAGVEGMATMLDEDISGQPALGLGSPAAGRCRRRRSSRASRSSSLPPFCPKHPTPGGRSAAWRSAPCC